MKPEWIDARQDVLERLLRSNRPSSRCGYRAVQNQLCSLARKEQRESRKCQQRALKAPRDIAHYDPSFIVMREEERSLVWQEVSRLSTVNQDVIYRRYVLKETYASIAQSLGKSTAAIQKQVERALEQLRTRPALRTMALDSRCLTDL